MNLCLQDGTTQAARVVASETTGAGNYGAKDEVEQLRTIPVRKRRHCSTPPAEDQTCRPVTSPVTFTIGVSTSTAARRCDARDVTVNVNAS